MPSDSSTLNQSDWLIHCSLEPVKQVHKTSLWTNVALESTFDSFILNGVSNVPVSFSCVYSVHFFSMELWESWSPLGPWTFPILNINMPVCTFLCDCPCAERSLKQTLKIIQKSFSKSESKMFACVFFVGGVWVWYLCMCVLVFGVWCVCVCVCVFVCVCVCSCVCV